MGSTSYLSKSKVGGYRAKSGSSVGSDKEINGKLKRAKIRRPGKMNEYGLKRIPDYTELAYKEAVSKLRYFLSGNYAPSLRSYGSPASIKNLDESDGDTADKKYGTSYGQLTEYKARPRLTTKYTTLYADSLKNYSQPNLTVTPPAAPAANDLSGGTNPDVINFIQKQEEYIEQLERESQYCRDELNNLLGKVKEVISENEHLHEAQKNKLISRMFHTYNYAGSETDDVDDQGDSTGLDSDCKVTPAKAKRQPTKSRGSKLEGPNIVFESRIAELEAQLAQSKIDLKKLQEENNENKRKLANGLVDSTCLDGFKRQIDNLQRDKNSLEAQVAKLKISLEQKDGDLDMKYKRSVDGIEHQLRDERNNLEAEVRRLKEDLSNERSKIRELCGEGARRAIQERSAAEQRYNAHFDELSHDLAAQYDCVAKLQLDLERQRREENDLKRELSLKAAAVEELKMELKNKSSNLQADLAQAYAEKASLEEELASARLALERVQRQSKHEVNRLNSEIQSLRQRLDRADADLVHSRRENLRLSEQISTLEKELNMKNLTPLSPEKTKKEKELSSVLESMENKHAETVAELESMIHSQNTLMEKLTGECRLLTDKLDDNNRRHKEEMAHLQHKVDSLGRSLQQPDASQPRYEAPTTHATPAYRNDNAAAYTRPNDTRDNATRDSKIGQPSINNIRGNGDHSDQALIEPKTQETSDIEPQYQTNSESTPIEPDIQIQDNPETTQNEVEQYQGDYSEQAYAQEDYDQNYTDGQYQQQYDPNFQYTEGYDPNTQNMNPNAQFNDPNNTNAQYNDPNNTTAQYNDPNNTTAQYNDPNNTTAQYNDPNNTTAQYNDPNNTAAQYNDPNNTTAQYNDPNNTTAQYNDPNAQYNDPNDPDAQYNYNTDYPDQNYAQTPQYETGNEYEQPKQEYVEKQRSNSPKEDLPYARS